jgi:hypothetical protein
MQRPGPRRFVKVADEEEGQSAEVIAMKVADKNGIEPLRVKTGPFHGQQGGRPAVYEKASIGGFNEIAALVAASAAESISTAGRLTPALAARALGARSVSRSGPTLSFVSQRNKNRVAFYTLYE